MAKATLVKAKPVKQPPNKVILELSEGEADFILALTARIGGHPEHSPRKYSERICTALTVALGFAWDGTDAEKLMTSSSRIYFNNYRA